MKNLELEKAVLSIIYTDPKLLLESEVNENYFTTTTHQKIFKLLKTYWENLEIIQWKLNEDEISEFYEIVSKITNRASWDEDIKQLKELKDRRDYYSIARSIEIACKWNTPINAIKEKIWEFDTEEIRKETKQDVLQIIWDIMLWTREFKFYETWYKKLDELIVWFVPWQLNVIAARPSVWKTMFWLNTPGKTLKLPFRMA